MANVAFNGQTVVLEEGESVLDGLLRHGHDIPYGCKAGACHACVMHVEEGQLPLASQKGLKPSQQQLASFLSCSCMPTESLSVSLEPQELPVVSAAVSSVDHIACHILRIQLKAPFEFEAGQYINIWHDEPRTKEPLIRSYSIASVSNSGSIELHVKVIPDGRFSAWASENLKAGDSLLIQGPLGECIYSNDSPNTSLLLVGIGTGLAPLYGIVCEALKQGHKGQIHLVLGARSAESFYLISELLTFSEKHPQLTVYFVAQQGDHPNLTNDYLVQDDLYQAVKQRFPNLGGYRVYLCGAGSFVGKMKKQCFLAGASMKDIHTDSFLPCS